MILDYCLGDFKFCYFQVDSTLKNCDYTTDLELKKYCKYKKSQEKTGKHPKLRW